MSVFNMNEKIHDLTVKDFSGLFNVEEFEMPQACIDIINNRDFRYRFLGKEERDKIIIDMINRINFKRYTPYVGKEKWEKGWQENLDTFIKNGYNKKSLVPYYIRDGLPIRLFGDYVKSYDKKFEINFIDLIITFVFYKYLKDKNSIYEFGCGSCYNLLSFAEMCPDKYYYGYDWVEQSRKIIDVIRDHYNFNIYGGVFDMINPNNDLKVEENSVSFTLGSLEQLGKKYDNFIDFLLKTPFSRHVHINSILEEYDIENNITDYLTYRLETERNYCNGFFTKLKKLDRDDIIKIKYMNRIRCGGLFGDGYSITVWEKT